MLELKSRWDSATDRGKWAARGATFVAKLKATKAVWLPPDAGEIGDKASTSATKTAKGATKKSTSAAKKSTGAGRKSTSAAKKSTSSSKKATSTAKKSA
ncbi:MAG TPA: hypothetical protein VFV89_03400 [Nocardioides sp.]|uniref:hypothetical protein n=1 Tax=Nocardioides sp. TaxID=35761 RepID=UPI002E324F6A|nr:hypothetical protein [Nocardioides sp.]HEX5086827.1 hypothetical protein [Nocardioides sp.]